MPTRLVSTALRASLKETKTGPQDQAAIALAAKYAKAIDEDTEGKVLWHIGPRLVEVLVELGMTPKARAVVLTGFSDDDARALSKLDELRERRARRTAHLDAPAATADA